MLIFLDGLACLPYPQLLTSSLVSLNSIHFLNIVLNNIFKKYIFSCYHPSPHLWTMEVLLLGTLIAPMLHLL